MALDFQKQRAADGRAVLAPHFRKFATEKFDIPQIVAPTSLGVVVQVPAKMREHLWSGPCSKFFSILASVGGLDFSQQRLEAIEVFLAD